MKILLALPTYDGSIHVDTAVLACTQAYKGEGELAIYRDVSSLLAGSFNKAWCVALNDPAVTHFAMLHADIIPQPWFLNILKEEMEAHQATVISTVMPIKDHLGLTSTGIGDPASSWCPLKRFTMTEIMQLPETFSIKDTEFPNAYLVFNTGCWLADLSKLRRWFQTDVLPPVPFTIRDRICRGEDGLLHNEVCPEDFGFARLMWSLTEPVVVTRKVAARHMGTLSVRNDVAWGEWKEDEATRPLWENSHYRRRDTLAST